MKPICKVNELNGKRNVFDEHLCEIIKNELNASLSHADFCQMIENLSLKCDSNNVFKKDVCKHWRFCIHRCVDGFSWKLWNDS